MSYYELAVERIKKIDAKQYIGVSNKSYSEVRSRGEYKVDARLIAEYYRRVGVYLQFISKEVTSIYAGMDMLIGYKMADNEWDELLGKCPNFVEIDFMLMKLISIHYLRWCTLLDSSNNIALQFPDIYEPMIILFERGGGQISTHHHELVGGFGAFSRSIDAKRGDKKPIDISDNALKTIIEEIELAEAYLVEHKKGNLTEKYCIRCGNRLIIHSNNDFGQQWYKIKCETKDCFDNNFS
ncbi:hypothetical protein UY416_03210 [Paenibacillus polymyxa]|uniref:hypothetical protein n=1 Tax=Paenibacillus polymyxa TaxID=1406 RepID=UPI002AB51CFD|nr:hypothetical protein [Paenibacillus polymyxa]MDY8045299.1 hypothetical protein [Paenibacillus polymyxa]